VPSHFYKVTFELSLSVAETPFPWARREAPARGWFD
jgi:hypothetical protein